MPVLCGVATICKEWQIIAYWGVGRSDNPFESRDLSKLHFVIYWFTTRIKIPIRSNAPGSVAPACHLWASPNVREPQTFLRNLVWQCGVRLEARAWAENRQNCVLGNSGGRGLARFLVNGMIWISRAQAVLYAYNVYKAESSDSPFFV